MKNYRKGKKVNAIVEDIYPFGVFTRLEDGKRAYIRCRELSLSRDQDPRKVVRKGDELKAVILKLPEEDRIMELSIRLGLPDPWKAFLEKSQAEQVVRGVVRNVFPDRVYLEISPGVNGVIAKQELANWEVEHLDKIIWSDDHIEAVIIRIDHQRKIVRLSIRQRLEQLAQASEFYKQLNKNRNEVKVPNNSILKDISIAQPSESRKSHTLISILVVEDRFEVRDPLVRWLSEQGYQTIGVERAEEGLKLYRQNIYSVVLVDINLPVMNGLDFIRKLKSEFDTAIIGVMSDPELIEKRLERLQALGVNATFSKPLDTDELLIFLDRVSNGDITHLEESPKPDTLPDDIQIYRDLSKGMRSGKQLEQLLLPGLCEILKMTRAEQAIVFQMDPASARISIAASCGGGIVNENAIHALVDSPVNDVITRDIYIWENHVHEEQARRFEKLLELLDFRSCIGVPIQANGNSYHALFLFHTQSDAFSKYRLRDTFGMAMLLSIALENQTLNERVQNLAGLLLSGHLAASLAHETNNKISGLDLQFRNMRSDIIRLEVDQRSAQQTINQIKNDVITVTDTIETLKKITKDFLRLMEVRQEAPIDLEQVLTQAKIQIHHFAEKAGVVIEVRSAKKPIQVLGNSLSMLQVFLNLMLNAIQNMEKKQTDQRELIIYCSQEVDNVVSVRFRDTGLGIHSQLWERIFDLGYTTRLNGSGLGLFIARSLVFSMAGKIFVEESFILLGTTFVVELPRVGNSNK